MLVKGTARPKVGSGATASLVGTIKRDTKAGDVNGEGLEGKWYVVNVKGALVRHAVAASPTTTTSSSGGRTYGY